MTISLKSLTKNLSALLVPSALMMSMSFVTTSAIAANITEADVQAYASKMKAAANSKNLNQVSSLVDDDALISLSRNGKTTSLDKSAYLNLLQDSWSNSNSYSYDITVSNIVTSGEQAKANVKTIESWDKNGVKRTFTTTSRATLRSSNNNAVLLRAVSQVTID